MTRQTLVNEMTTIHPDLITTEIDIEIEVEPKHASLLLIVEGESNFQKNSSFKQSKEIASFINDLSDVDYSHENIRLKNLKIKEQTGKLLKSSTASFTLILDKIPLNLIPQIIAISSIQKNIEVKNIEYDYGVFEVEKPEILRRACEQAKEQAKLISHSFGVSLLGIHSMKSQWIYPKKEKCFDGELSTSLHRYRSLDHDQMESMNFTSNHKSLLKLSLITDFRVSDFI